MKGLEKITGRILDDARADAEAAVAEAEKQAAEILADAQADAERRAAECRERSARDAEASENRARSGASAAGRSIISGVKAAAVDRTFDEAEKLLASLDGEKRSAFLRGLLLSALRCLEGKDGGNAELILSPADKALLGDRLVSDPEATAVCGEKGLVLVCGEADEKAGGGLILRVGDISVNCSAAECVASVRQQLEGGVYAGLFE